MPDHKKHLHLVSHTHWDREWRLTFQELRMKLVDCIDNLLEIMDKEPGFKHYTLDGQASIIDDYLAIRPENREKIVELVREMFPLTPKGLSSIYNCDDPSSARQQPADTLAELTPISLGKPPTKQPI